MCQRKIKQGSKSLTVVKLAGFTSDGCHWLWRKNKTNKILLVFFFKLSPTQFQRTHRICTGYWKKHAQHTVGRVLFIFPTAVRAVYCFGNRCNCYRDICFWNGGVAISVDTIWKSRQSVHDNFWRGFTVHWKHSRSQVPRFVWEAQKQTNKRRRGDAAKQLVPLYTHDVQFTHTTAYKKWNYATGLWITGW